MKNKTKYICQNCFYESPKWLGKCSSCESWNSFEETSASYVRPKAREALGITNEARKIPDIEVMQFKRLETQIKEFDRVFGGGIVQGSLTLIAGEPGVGKSTLLTHMMGQIGSLNKNEPLLYVSGEESIQQVAQRMMRLGLKDENIYLLNESCWEMIQEQIQKIKPLVVVIDSIQTTISQQLQTGAGSLSQIKEVTQLMMEFFKSLGTSCLMVGHINKDGQIAGPKVLEHMVDTVVYFEGEKNGQYRILKSIKNRYGATNEIGLFEMKEHGLRSVENASKYFLDHISQKSTGRSLTCLVEGSRVLMIEVQALVLENKYAQGRRVSQGVDHNHLVMLIAIIEKHLEINLSNKDIYLNIAGGLKVDSREIDLSIIASIYSSAMLKPLNAKGLFIGEVGLCGELRNVSHLELRLKEAENLGLKKVLAPRGIEGKHTVAKAGFNALAKITELPSVL